MLLEMYGSDPSYQLSFEALYGGTANRVNGVDSFGVGTWRKVELLCESGTGRYRCWLDEVLQIDFTQATTATFWQFKFDPVWGGYSPPPPGEYKTEPDYY